ncbi:cytochrome P450 CYP72A219-like [Salvia miltiorrhiza]|uniref:cytochrome P450 CYP72A219-like n=1 Tax=Salvia miltiorrhiza TaxID=226208 RepID=UPI0025AB8F72|nr:cytochrome P450 CYP72A219-like [Salvia miltiorrhiza]
MNLLYLILAIPCGVVASIYAWRFLKWAWLTPKKLEKSLRQQGFNGNPYKFLLGDLNEIMKMEKESLSNPISFSDDFLPRIMPFVHKTLTNYGKNSFVWFGTDPAVFIWDLDMIREILSKPLIFQKPSNPTGEVLAKGLVSYEGDKWAKHRRLINPAFHLEKIKKMAPSFYMSCCDMLSEWEKMVPSEGAFELDVWPYLQTLTSDAISRTAFGSSYEQGRKIFELQKELASLLMKATISFFIPGFRYLPTRTNRRIDHIRKEVESLLLDLIDKRMKAIEAGEAITDNLLDTLLESNFKEIQQKGNKFGMSLQDVVEECKLFYIAGQETTVALLVWTMILLGKHTDWQDRAREEIRGAFGGRQPDFEGLNALKTVSMILDEVVRLYPPVFMVGRRTHKETAIGDLIIPAGVNLILPSLQLHHHRQIWGDDADEFKPERFSEGVSSKAKGQQLKDFPFGWGPRICIGQNFAILEAKMAVAMILQRYSFELSPSYSHAPTAVLFLQPQHGAHLILRRL